MAPFCNAYMNSPYCSDANFEQAGIGANIVMKSRDLRPRPVLLWRSHSNTTDCWRSNAFWVGTSCCFIEFYSLIGSRFDFERYGLVPTGRLRHIFMEFQAIILYNVHVHSCKEFLVHPCKIGQSTITFPRKSIIRIQTIYHPRENG